MPLIQFAKDKPAITVEVGDNLMRSLMNADLPVASSCAGKGICSKCRIKIVSGTKNLSAESQLEIDLKARNQVPTDQRISCQTSVLGDITVDASYW